MHITGEWDPCVDDMFIRIGEIGTKVEQVIASQPPDVQRVGENLYNNASCLTGTLARLCKETSYNCSSQVAAVLLRALVDAYVAVLAFARDPVQRSRMYLDFEVILRYRIRIAMERHANRLGYANDRWTIARAVNKCDVSKVGAQFLKKRPPKDQNEQEWLKSELSKSPPSSHLFRSTWYPETRGDLLKGARLECIYDLKYKVWCSAVHSDVLAAECLGGMKRANVAMMALPFWGLAMDSLSKAMGVPMSPPDAKFLEALYGKLRVL